MKGIRVKFLPATEHRPASLKAYDCDGNYVTMPWDKAAENAGHYHVDKYLIVAKELCRKMNWGDGSDLVAGWIKDEWVFNFRDRSKSFRERVDDLFRDAQQLAVVFDCVGHRRTMSPEEKAMLDKILAFVRYDTVRVEYEESDPRHPQEHPHEAGQ